MKQTKIERKKSRLWSTAKLTNNLGLSQSTGFTIHREEGRRLCNCAEWHSCDFATFLMFLQADLDRHLMNMLFIDNSTFNNILI